MKNVSLNKVWGVETNTAHVNPPPIPLVKETSTSKSEGYYVDLKLHRYPTSSTLALYDFRMYLFDHGKPKEFVLCEISK